MESIHLVGDIGGTKTTLAVIDAAQGPKVFLDKVTFSSREYSSLEDLVREFLKHRDLKLAGATFGIAGPVIGGQVHATNLPWLIDEKTLSNKLNIHVKLLNDLSATAHAVPFLTKDDLQMLNPGRPEKHGSIAVIAPGTGLGEAYLHWNGIRYRAFPSEGGHADFAPVNQLQIRLLIYLLEHFEHVSYERICSGRGLPNIYSFLKEEAVFIEPVWLRDQLTKESDPSPVITRAALERTAEIAVATLDIFSSVLGAEAGNLALKILASGGIYLGGGIPPRIIPFLQKKTFLKSLQHKGRFESILKLMPVHVILNPETALIGAACHAIEMA